MYAYVVLPDKRAYTKGSAISSFVRSTPVAGLVPIPIVTKTCMKDSAYFLVKKGKLRLCD